MMGNPTPAIPLNWTSPASNNPHGQHKIGKLTPPNMLNVDVDSVPHKTFPIFVAQFWCREFCWSISITREERVKKRQIVLIFFSPFSGQI